MDDLTKNQTVSEICHHLGIARSTYYRCKKKVHTKTNQPVIERTIGTLCREHKFRYGYRKVTALPNQTFPIKHKKIQRIMQKNGWHCRLKTKKRRKTGQHYQIAGNLLKREFQAEKPVEKLVTDITYLPFGRKQLYLSSIQDLYNGEILAYSIGDRQDTNFVLNTLSKLPSLQEGCIMHSDQGSVYTSYAR